jgi:hypothetical protein
MARRPYPKPKVTAPVHINWKVMRTYRAVYRSPNGNEIVIRGLTRPPTKRSFRTAAGLRKHRLVKLQSSQREVIIVASTKNRKKAVEQDELEEIEALEELEDLEDLEDEEELEDEVEEDEEEEEEEPEDEVEDDELEEDEEDEEEEEAPRPKARTRKGTTAKAKTKTTRRSSSAKPGNSREAADGRVGTPEVAAHFNVDSRQLRVLLRRHDISPNADSGRYSWKSLNSPEVVKIGKLIKSGAHKEAQREAIDTMRKRQGVTDGKPAARTRKGTTTKKAPVKTTATKTTRRRRVVEEDED